jgi:tetratricopeptide (TPR) repeat protein
MMDEVTRQRRSVERAVLMHGTSSHRLDAARLLARIMRESHARGAWYGWSDPLVRARVSPIHTVTGGPIFRWEMTLPRGFAERIDRWRDRRWSLVIHGTGERRPRNPEPPLALAARSLQLAELHDCTVIPDQATRGPEGPFIALLDALRFAAFTIALPSDTPYLQDGLRRAISGLPPGARAPAEAVADGLPDHDRLSRALVPFGRALELEGRLAAGAAVYVILYELALLRCDLPVGLDAAQGAGRAFRKLADWHEALRWYHLGLRLAEHEYAFLQTARLLDGLGNTHRERGSFPTARQCYRDAWRFALIAGDRRELGNVALGLMTVEREAGRLDEAARIAWRALRNQTDRRERVNLLLNLGTLLRDGGAIELAEDTYKVVELGADDPEVRVMARDALAHCAALRGAEAEYARLRKVVRGAARTVSPYIRAQIGYFRGLSLRALRDERAPRVLRATERFARAHGLREWEVRAGGLAEQPIARSAPAVAAVRAPDDVRKGIESLLAEVSRGSLEQV